jgi:hypothetical protein
VLADPALAEQLRLAGVLAFIAALTAVQSGMLIGFKAFRDMAMVNFLGGISSATLLATGAHVAGVGGALYGLGIALGLQALLNYLLNRRAMERHGLRMRWSLPRAELPLLWRFSLPSVLTMALWSLGSWIASALLVRQPDGLAEMGLLAAANQWFSALMFIPGVLTQVLLPTYAERLAGDRPAEAGNLALRSAWTEVWPRLRGFLEDIGTRALAWLRLGRLGRPGAFAVLAVALGFTIVANGALVRTAANVFDLVIPPMQRPADWAAAKEPLAPWLTDAAIVLTTREVETLYYLGRYDVLISKSRQSEIKNGGEFSIDPRTGRPVIGTSESVALIMDCYPDGLIVSSGVSWRDPVVLDDAVANLVEAAAEEVELPAFGIKAYAWQQPDDARRTQACARLPGRLGDDVVARLERSHEP